jgi:hypothetical protein
MCTVLLPLCDSPIAVNKYIVSKTTDPEDTDLVVAMTELTAICVLSFNKFERLK